MTFVWVLVFLINTDNAGRTVGPFESQVACESARHQVNEAWGFRVRTTCMRVIDKR
jgi:hypothetical protein